MAILTSKPGAIVSGTTSGLIILDRALLKSQMNITDAFWSDSSNWDLIHFQINDSTNNENRWLIIDSTNAGTISFTSTARTNNWYCKRIILQDGVGGEYVIDRSSFPIANEFDITVSATAAPANVRVTADNQTRFTANNIERETY